MSYYTDEPNYNAHNRQNQQQQQQQQQQQPQQPPPPVPRRSHQDPYGYEPRTEGYTSPSNTNQPYYGQNYGAYDYRAPLPNQNYMHGPRPQAGSHAMPSPPQPTSVGSQYYPQGQERQQQTFQAYNPSMQSQPAPPQHQPYDPRNYGRPAYQPYTATVPNMATLTPPAEPPRYNPAAYQASSIANTIQPMYTSAHSPPVSYPTPPHTAPILQSANPSSPRTANTTGSPNAQQPAGSTPLPSRPFSFQLPPDTAPPVPPRDHIPGQQNPDLDHRNSLRSVQSSSPSQRYSPSPDISSINTTFATSGSLSNRQRPNQSNQNIVQQQYNQQSHIQTSPSGNNGLRHPNQRPLPGPPRNESSFSNDDSDSTAEEQVDEYTRQDRLFDEVETAVGGSHNSTPDTRQNDRDGWLNPNRPSAYRTPRPLFTSRGSLRENQVNGTVAEGESGGLRVEYTDDSDGASDLEAEGGLQAMRIAEEEEAQLGGPRFVNHSLPPRPATPEYEPEDEDEDYIPVDISQMEGGPAASISYGADPYERHKPYDQSGDFTGQHPSTSSRSSAPQYTETSAPRTSIGTSITEYSGFGVPAIVDEAGTGGFSDPGLHGRRLSFEEGDEAFEYEDQVHEGVGFSSGPPDTFYQPPMTNRPLPPPPPRQDSRPDWRPGEMTPSTSGPMMTPPVGVNPEDYYDNAGSSNSSYVPRSISLFSHPSSPQYIPPIRAKTAAEAKRQSYRNASYDAEPYDSIQSPGVGLDLPEIPPGRRFKPAKLKQEDFDLCMEPWAMSGVIEWLRAMSEGEVELREHVIVDALLALFTDKIPNMNFAEAEGLAAHVMTAMYQADVLVKEEEWLRFSGNTLTGVLYQLTGQGCYSQALHDHSSSTRCYSRMCQRTVKKLDLTSSSNLTADWATFYGLKAEDVQTASKKEIERQNIMHEIVQTEEQYMEQLKLLRRLYRDGLRNAKPPILDPTKVDSFLEGVFGKLDDVQKANEDYLLPQLKYRQKEQGPWITGFSDIFRDWIRKAKGPYISYAANFPNANVLMRHEEQKNIMFSSFLENVRNNRDSNRLGWDSFLKAPITRLQRYTLLLATVLRTMTQESSESASLQTAIEEIKAVTLDCDARVDEMGRKADLSDLASRLVLRPEMKKANIDLKLNQLGRELLFKGDLQRTGGTRFTWLETHTLLFDNFLVLAKTVYQKDSSGGPKFERYDVSKMPIPMDVLVLESTNDDPVVKSFKGTATVSGPQRGTQAATQQVPGGNSLTHTATNTSISTVDSTSSSKTMVTATNLDGATKDEKILYPFRVKHLGKDPYTLFAHSAQNRKEWCDKIIEAKTKHAASLFAQNAEPFRLRVLADTAFAYDVWSGGPKTVMIKGTPLSRAIDDVEKAYSGGVRPGPVCRARVNCATTFHHLQGKQMVAVGTDYGVYITETGNPRGWNRAIPVLKVTQLAVLEEFNLFLLISDKALIAYHLDVVCQVAGGTATEDSIRKAPQKLSGARDVGFFVTGRMKDRILLFYKKREGLSSTFKVLEPILQKSTTAKARPFSLRRGSTDFFREYDEFYIPTETNALNLFNTSLSAATGKGFEVLNLDKKTPWSVPDLSAPSVSSIAARLATSGCALAMFRLDDTEFLCVYEQCAVYVNKHGDVSRGVVMEFVGHARAAALEAGYLVLFDNDFVEIRDAGNGRLKQVIPGRDVRCLDDGKGGLSNGAGAGTLGRSVKFAMQHPEQERAQLVLEIALNESRK